MNETLFANREEAAQQLLPLLETYRGNKEVLIIGLPGGGIAITEKLAKELNIPLDVVVVNKLTSPYNQDFAVGAITEDGEQFFDWTLNEEICGPKEFIQHSIELKRKETLARADKYRKILPMRDLHGKTVILTDDCIMTGATIRAAIKAAKKRGAKKIVVAVPVASRDSLAAMSADIDEVAVPHAVEFFSSEGRHYGEFPQIEDEQAISILKKYAAKGA
jgi:putative phosphoribosyl transferase